MRKQSILVLALLFAVIWLGTGCALPAGAGQRSQPYPPPDPPPSPAPTLTRVAPPTVGPTATKTVTPFPTSASPLLPGPKVVYEEHTAGKRTIWAASADNLSLRHILATIDDPAQFGTQESLSHDGRKIAYTVLPAGSHNRDNADLWVIDLVSSQRRKLASKVDIGGYINYPVWSPDDQWVIFNRHQGQDLATTDILSAINIATGVETTLDSAPAGAIFALDWSLDGHTLYYLKYTTRAELWSLDLTQAAKTAKSIRPIEAEYARCYFMSPNRQYLLCTILQVRNPPKYAAAMIPVQAALPMTVLASGAPDEIYSPIWRPNGQDVTVRLPAQASQPSGLGNINIQSRSASMFVPYNDWHFIPRAWSTNGQWLVAQLPGKNTALFLISNTGKQIQQIIPSGGIEFITWFDGNLP